MIKVKKLTRGAWRKLVDLNQDKADVNPRRRESGPADSDIAIRQSVLQKRSRRKSAVAVATTHDRHMIVIARHGRPALDRHIWINSEQYVSWWAAYDAGGLAADQRAPNGLIEALRACKLIVSSSL
jgi:hypothetical protein